MLPAWKIHELSHPADVGLLLPLPHFMRLPMLAVCVSSRLAVWWQRLRARAWPPAWYCDPSSWCDPLAACGRCGPLGRCCGLAGVGLAPLRLRLMHWPVSVSCRLAGYGGHGCALGLGRVAGAAIRWAGANHRWRAAGVVNLVGAAAWAVSAWRRCGCA
jgi:hypothetical protein